MFETKLIHIFVLVCLCCIHLDIEGLIMEAFLWNTFLSLLSGAGSEYLLLSINGADFLQ